MARRVIDGYYDIARKTFLNSEGKPIGDSLLPEFCYIENPVFRLRLVDGDINIPYTALAGASSYSAAMDNDYQSGTVTGVLADGVSGAIESLSVNSLSSNEIPSPGMIDLVNAYDETETIVYTAFSSSEGTVTFAFPEQALTYTYAAEDAVAIPLSPLMFMTENSGINVAGDWEDDGTADPAQGQFSIRVDADTVGYLAKIGEDEYLSSRAMARFELQAHDSAGVLVGRVRFVVKATNLINPGDESLPQALPRVYSTTVETDAKYVPKTKVNTDGGSIPDDAEHDTGFSEFCGLVFVSCADPPAVGPFIVQGDTVVPFGASPDFTTTPDNAGTINVYFSGGHLTVQNKTGDTISAGTMIFNPQGD